MPLKIYRRPGSSIWHYRGTLAGCRLRGSAGTSNKETAARLAAKVEDEFWKRRVNGPQREVLTFPKAAALYLAAGKPERFVAKLVKHFGDSAVKDISAGAIRQAAIDIYPNCSGASRNRQVIVPMQAIINHCAEMEQCSHLKMKRFKVESEIKKPVTREWLDKFTAHATKPEIAALGVFMFATGARISEALDVEWDDLNLTKRTVLIRQTKIGNERIAHLPMNLVLILANLSRKTKPFPFAGPSSAMGPWEATIKAAGIERLTFHCCRHGFATGLLRRGVDVITVAKLGGWKSAQHVFQTYGHAHDDNTVTDRLFDTSADTEIQEDKQNQRAN